MSLIKSIIEYLNYFWTYRKTKWGLFLGFMSISVVWYKCLIPFLPKNEQRVFYITFSYLMLISIFIVWWLFHSGRIFWGKKKFTVVFCLKAKDLKSTIHIQNTISILNRELDALRLLEKFKIVFAGEDVITNHEKAYNYRGNKNLDLVIWGEILSGTKEEKEVCDFKGLFFTCKIPSAVVRANLTDIFKRDINIALINRDWNIYEINSLPDTEKISAHLSEMIMFILGLIYCQSAEYAEDSIVILESLFKRLDMQTKGDQIKVDFEKKFLQTTPSMLRKGRVLGILLNVYKNLGLYLVSSKDYRKAKFYLDKFRSYEKKDIPALASLALCAFYLKDIKAAKEYTEEISTVDKHNEIFILNRAFFGILEKNYASALCFYKEIIKKGRSVNINIITKVIAFLDERKSEYPNEFAYDLAIGLLSYYFCQEQMGIKELRKFAKHTKNKAEYRGMVNYITGEILDKKKVKKN